MFDLAVNGGGLLTINYQKTGVLTAQRQVNAHWQDFIVAPDVILIPVDTQVTTVTANAAVIQVARGSVVSDSEGTRRATVLFPAGTGASIVLPNGTLQPIGTLNIRATEYTVGPSGPKTMPAELPPNSGYTYAVELSVDEAMANVAGREVVFTQPVPVYLENFLGFPVGEIAPLGYYDRDRAAWVPASNGRVIKITAVSGGLATVDTVGTRGLPPIVLDSAELQSLASLYSVGQELWRTQVTHFSTYDTNWGFDLPPGAVPPPNELDVVDNTEDDPCDVSGNSIIECQNQILGETIGIVGTPFGLQYQSERVPGRKVDNEREMIEEFARRLGTQMIHFLPRDNDVQRAEIKKKTVIEWNPECPQADEYRKLARAMDTNEMFVIPTPLAIPELESLLLDYGLVAA